MPHENDPRVLVVDNNEEIGLKLEGLLKPRHYNVEIARGTGPTLEDDAAVRARQFRPHVAIIDLRLYSDEQDDLSGMRLLTKLCSARCIVYSAYLSPEATREVKQKYGAMDWVGKSENPADLMRLVQKAARRSCAGRHPIELETPGWDLAAATAALYGKRPAIAADMINDVLRQAFEHDRAICLEPLGGITSPFAAVSRGHSVVLKAQSDGFEPVVVKLAAAKKIRREALRHEKYVKDRLVGLCYARLERTVEFWDFGAAVYSFIGSSQRSLPSFSRAYRDARTASGLLKTLDHFFGEVWSRHYRARPVLLHGSLFDAYDKELHLQRHLSKRVGRISLSPDGCSDWACADPISWVLEHRGYSLLPGARQAVTHGDLHADNLFVDGERAWAIDFGRTGPGHILRDFVELEVDLITRLVGLPDDNCALFRELVAAVVTFDNPAAPLMPAAQLLANEQTRRALEVIQGLRELAWRATGCDDPQEYLWALLLDSVFVAALVPKHSLQARRALLLSAMLCRRLEQLDNG